MAAYFDRPALDDVFRALADPGRRRLLDSLNARNGQTLRELCADMDMVRQSVSKHLAVLQEANLVTTVWRGREKLHYLNAAPITDISERWINRYEQPRVDALTDLKHALENPSMERPSFVYTTYIQTTPERLWEALTSSAFTQRYWSAAFETDWAPGSEMVWNLFGVRITPELARAAEVSEDLFAAAAGEPRSKVTFELEPAGSAVKLTVVHDGFPVESTAATLVSNGWPRVLSRLKTLLETGDTFRIDSQRPPTTQGDRP
jgi:DNA-binding transcriptional ArsR family regulator/uncharacterized protein YndB with AHSA1/START domain